MSRILLTWELGLNLGHLTRLLPLAQQLKQAGHSVLVATRDIQAATAVLVPAGIPFVQAPHLPMGIPLTHRPAGYADILLSQGWSDPAVLCGLTHAWVNIIGLFRPDRMILDYSPTVSLAARIVGIPTVLVGNGFELPPQTDPLPCFPGFSWATPAKAAKSEGIAVASANSVLHGYRASPITALRDLVLEQARLLATFPDLDHYGERADAQYIGPLLAHLNAPRVDWPPGNGPKIFACLRPDTTNVCQILHALGEMEARAVCVIAGFAAPQLEAYQRSHIRFSRGPVDLSALGDADLCITYGAEGTMLNFLRAGVPQVVSPWHVEAFMAARRIEAQGLGISLSNAVERPTLAAVLTASALDTELHQRAADFACRARNFAAARPCANSLSF